MKKLVFSISLILSYTFIAIAGVVKSIPAKADEFTNGNIITVTPSISETDLNTYNNALQVLEYLRQGGSIDFSNVSDNYTSGDLLDEFVDLIDTVGSGIDYYGNNFLNNIFDLSSDTVQLSPNTKLKDRIGQFRSNLPSYLNRNSSSEPTPTPDPNFAQYIDNINGTGFWWKNYANSDGSGHIGQIYYPPSSCSWFTQTQMSNSMSWIYVMSTSIRNVYINEDGNGNYICTINIPSNEFYLNFCENGVGRYSVGTPYNNAFYYSGNAYNFNFSVTSTLTDCFARLVQKVKNVNIYVNGVPWSIVGDSTNYNISLGTGTYLKETNQPIEYRFEIPVYVDISDLLDKIQLAIDNKITLDFPYLNDLIVDTNGQQTIAVTVFSEDYTIDDLYVKDYGAMIPLFPLWVEYPVALEHINTVATVGIVDVIPADIIEVLGIFLIVGLFVFLCHRLME